MLNIVENNLEKDLIKTLKKMCKRALKLSGQNPNILEIFLEFNNDKEMQELNKKTRKIDATTDVLSFPNLENIFNKKIVKKAFKLDINPQTKKIFLGDIVINLNKAKEQAKEYDHSLTREICYLFVHGLLHLLEFDHEDELDKNLMRGQEELILSKFKLKKD